MARSQNDANLTVCFEPAYAWSMTRPGVNDYERPLGGIDLDASRRDYPNQGIVHRSWQFASIIDQLAVELQNMRCGFRGVLLEARATLLHDVQEQESTLARIEPITPCIPSDVSEQSIRHGLDPLSQRVRRTHLVY